MKPQNQKAVRLSNLQNLKQNFYKFPGYEFTSQLGTSVTTGASVLFVQSRYAPIETQHTNSKGPSKNAGFTTISQVDNMKLSQVQTHARKL